MGRHVNPSRLALRGTPAYAAGEYLYQMGPKLAHQLFAAVELGNTSTRPEEALQSALAYGWLIERDGRIDISSYARAHFDAIAGIEVVQPIGQIAAPRTVNVFASSGLSKRYIPSSRGTRQDIPAWSVRAGDTSFHKA